MSDDTRPAAAVLIGGISGLLVADVVLIAKGFAPETAVLRTPGGKVFVAALALHVADCLGPADPFRFIAWSAARISAWTSRGVHIP